MANSNRLLWIAVLLLVACSGELASAAEPDLCSLIPPTVLSKTLGKTYGAPKKTVAPRPFANTNEGTDCTYESGGSSFLFRIYVDPSPSASTDLFARLKGFFGRGSKDVSGMGDEAYLDKGGALHVRKGKVRYFLGGGGTPKQLNDLAIAVAAQL